MTAGTIHRALAPLLDIAFFEQVFIDEGAVAWPGDIDLAPDAMYADLTRQPLATPGVPTGQNRS